MECRVVLVIVLTIGFVGFSTAGLVEKRTSCTTQCENCYPGNGKEFERMGCEGDCNANGGTISCDATKRASSSSSLNQKVVEFNTNWANLMKARDIDAIKAIYTTDCAYVTVTSIVQQGFGKEAMGDAYKNWFDGNERIDEVEFTVLKAAEGSGLVFAHGKMKGYSGGSQAFEYNYIKFYKKSSDGSHKGYIDIVWS